jgi:SAM-dependent methyltransferase
MRRIMTTRPRARHDDTETTLFGIQKRIAFVDDALRSIGGDPKVLDIGCGTGEHLTLPLAERGWRITGVDIDEDSIARGRQLAAERALHNATFATTPLEAMTERYDVVILSECIEHVHEPDGLLAAVRERLMPGGHLVLTLPNGFGPYELDQFFWKRNFLFVPALHRRYVARRGRRIPPATLNDEGSPHVQWFSWRRINRLIRASGFEVAGFRPRTFLAGGYIGSFVNALELAGFPARRFYAWNARVSDRLPPHIASGWMFLCRKTAADG